VEENTMAMRRRTTSRPRPSIPTWGDNSTIDPIMEQLDTQGMSRRDLLQTTALGLAAASSLAALGCGGSKAGTSGGAAAAVSSTKKGKVAGLILTPNQYTKTMGTAGRQTAKILGLSQYTEGNENLDPVQAVTLANQNLSRGFDMLWVCGIDGSECRPINRAASRSKSYHSNMWAGGPWFMPVDANEYYTAFWDLHDPPNIYASTKLMLQELSDRFKGKEAKVFHIAGFPGGSLAFRRTAGVHQALAEFPNVKLVGELAGKWDPVIAQKAFQDLTGKNGKADAVICSNDAMLTGVLAAAKGLGYKPGDDLLLCGQDGNPDVLEAIKRGDVWSTNFSGPMTFAVHPIVRMYDVMNGAKFSPLERQMWVNGINVTKDNVDGLLDRYYGDESRLAFDPKLVSRHLHPNDWDPQVDLSPIDIEAYWKGVADKPSSYQLPADYAAELKAGGLDKVTATFKEHYKIKMDDFSYKGVAA
jgi:ABC-type sugar transport system substrate-binding protein